MRILVIGAGAREHVIAWKLSQDPGVEEVLCAPGNPGIGAVARRLPIPGADIDALLGAVHRERVGLTVVGPEAPLAVGLVDRFTAAGHPVFGPTRDAARLETSKAFAKQFMARHGVPTARFSVCETPDAARRAVAELGIPVVLKADGLAAGKGVVVADDEAAASEAIDMAMVGRRFGEAGDRLVVEEFLVGEEASFFVLCDGERGAFVGTAQDHKRVFDHDQGPNTGGMGAFAPSPLVNAAMRATIEADIVRPVLAGMAAEGSPFRGFLYVGLMITAEGPKVVEFNVRFGDPEAQVVLPSLAEPLAPWLAAAAEGRLPGRELGCASGRYVGVVLASGGYPGDFDKGHVIAGLDNAQAMPDVLVFHAGTAVRDGRVVTAGGRVLTVVGHGPDYDTAMQHAYAAVRTISFPGCHYRTDIGRKALGR